jgi:hypothetical protein
MVQRLKGMRCYKSGLQVCYSIVHVIKKPAERSLQRQFDLTNPVDPAAHHAWPVDAASARI